MGTLFTSISRIINTKSRIELYSQLNQHLIGCDGIILWNEDMLPNDDEIYEKFKIGMKTRCCRFYSLNSILPYHDFCIALLCSVDYSLNHLAISNVKEKTFMSAWRNMNVLSDVGDQGLQAWLKVKLANRSSDGYCNTLQINRQNVPVTRRHSSATLPTKLILDAQKISRACLSGKVKEINKDTPLVISSVVFESTGTPEGQLESIRMVHKAFICKSF